jgi:hypothetical protein
MNAPVVEVEVQCGRIRVTESQRGGGLGRISETSLEFLMRK